MRHPRLHVWLPALLLLAGAATPALADREILVREESKTFALEGARVLRLDVPVGEVNVEAGEGAHVEVRLKVHCDNHRRRCRERAEQLVLEPTRVGGDLRIRLRGEDDDDNHGVNHPEVELRLTVPAELDLAVDLGVGELNIDSMQGDITVDLGVGEVRVVVPEEAVRSVGIDVGVGEAQLSPRQEDTHRSGFLFLGNEIDWREGTGQSRIVVDVGVGEANVRLVP